MQSSLRGSTSLWDAGLDGSDQVIQVADTGIDLKSCAISNEPTGNVAPTKWDVGAFDPTRRKVVQWVAGAYPHTFQSSVSRSLPSPSVTPKPSEEGVVAWHETGDLDPASKEASGAGRRKFAATAIATTTVCMVLNFLCLLRW